LSSTPKIRNLIIKAAYSQDRRAAIATARFIDRAKRMALS
jgi:hypothetical protein